MQQKATFAALATGLLLAVGQASATTLTFDGLAVGTTLSNQYAALGATFAPGGFSGPGTSSSGEPWASNTGMTIVDSLGTDTGALGSPSLVSGNILHGFDDWLGENGDPVFTITFSEAASDFSATFAGVFTASDVTIYAFNGAVQVGSVSGSGTNAQFVLSYNAGPFTSIVVRNGSFNDWVGVDNITYTLGAVPEASTYAMMGLGLAVLALRRRKAA